MKKIPFILAIIIMTASCHSPKDIVLENMMTRTSVRAYTQEPVSAEDQELLLRAAMAAPCAKNRQLWEFVVVDQRSVLDSLASGLRYAKMLTSAPLAIAVCVRDTYVDRKSGDICPNGCWESDGAIAAQNILLEANALSLGAVYTAAQDDERSAWVRSVLGIPAEVHPVCVIAVGHPAEFPEPKDKWKPEKIHRNTYFNMFEKIKAKPAPCTDMKQVQEQYAANPAAWDSAAEFLSGDLAAAELGRHELQGGAFANVQEYNSKEVGKFEYHENFIDIQYIVSGVEQIGICPRENLIRPIGEGYNPVKDCALFEDATAADFVKMAPDGVFTILFPNEAHCPGMKVGESVPVKKVVVKIPFKK